MLADTGARFSEEITYKCKQNDKLEYFTDLLIKIYINFMIKSTKAYTKTFCFEEFKWFYLKTVFFRHNSNARHCDNINNISAHNTNSLNAGQRACIIQSTTHLIFSKSYLKMCACITHTQLPPPSVI